MIQLFINCMLRILIKTIVESMSASSSSMNTTKDCKEKIETEGQKATNDATRSAATSAPPPSAASANTPVLKPGSNKRPLQ